MGLIRTLQTIVNYPLNRSHKVQSIIRFLKWQLGSRLVPGELIYSWINDAKIIIRHGESGDDTKSVLWTT